MARARTYKFQTPLIPDLHDADRSSTKPALTPVRWITCWNCAGRRDGYHPRHASISTTRLANNPDMDPELRAFFDFNSMHRSRGMARRAS